MIDSSIYGLPLIQSPHAGTSEQRKKYPKRKAKNASHHARMNKKWLRRYGKVFTPGMFKLRDPFTGRESFIVHPTLMPRLRAALKTGGRDE